MKTFTMNDQWHVVIVPTDTGDGYIVHVTSESFYEVIEVDGIGDLAHAMISLYESHGPASGHFTVQHVERGTIVVPPPALVAYMADDDDDSYGMGRVL